METAQSSHIRATAEGAQQAGGAWEARNLMVPPAPVTASHPKGQNFSVGTGVSQEPHPLQLTILDMVGW